MSLVSVLDRTGMPVDLFRSFFQGPVTQTANVAARVDGSPSATIDLPASLAPPGISCQAPHPICQGVVDGNAEEPLSVDFLHLSSEVGAMVGSTHENVVLPLMDHLMGQCIKDDPFPTHRSARKLLDQG